MRRMEPDELFVFARFAGPHDPDYHPAASAQASSSGTGGYLAVGFVLHAGGSGGAHVLPARRAASVDTALDCDGLLSAGRGGVRVGVGGVSGVEHDGASLSVGEFPSSAGADDAVWDASVFADDFPCVCHCGAGGGCFELAVREAQLEIRDAACRWMAGNDLPGAAWGFPRGGLLEPMLRLCDCGGELPPAAGAQQHGQAGDCDRLCDLG